MQRIFAIFLIAFMVWGLPSRVSMAEEITYEVEEMQTEPRFSSRPTPKAQPALQGVEEAEGKRIEPNVASSETVREKREDKAKSQDGSRWGDSLRKITVFSVGMSCGAGIAKLFGVERNGAFVDLLGALVNILFLGGIVFLAFFGRRKFFNKKAGESLKNTESMSEERQMGKGNISRRDRENAEKNSAMAQMPKRASTVQRLWDGNFDSSERKESESERKFPPRRLRNAKSLASAERREESALREESVEERVGNPSVPLQGDYNAKEMADYYRSL